MQTDIHEIAPGIFRLSTFVPEIAPAGFTFNQFLIHADEPLLFHCGPRAHVSAGVRRGGAGSCRSSALRWISFGHVESDECGAMNQWLAAAPERAGVLGPLGCKVSLNDLADRPPRAAGRWRGARPRRQARAADRHAACAAWLGGAVLFEETSRTLLCGDLFTHVGERPPR